jgi:hypothetical protein
MDSRIAVTASPGTGGGWKAGAGHENGYLPPKSKTPLEAGLSLSISA